MDPEVASLTYTAERKTPLIARQHSENLNDKGKGIKREKDGKKRNDEQFFFSWNSHRNAGKLENYREEEVQENKDKNMNTRGRRTEMEGDA